MPFSGLELEGQPKLIEGSPINGATKVLEEWEVSLLLEFPILRDFWFLSFIVEFSDGEYEYDVAWPWHWFYNSIIINDTFFDFLTRAVVVGWGVFEIVVGSIHMFLEDGGAGVIAGINSSYINPALISIFYVMG